MKQLHKNKWFLIGLILITFFSSTGSSLIVVAETLDFSEYKVNPNEEIERNDTGNTEDAVSSSKNESTLDSFNKVVNDSSKTEITQTQETTDESHTAEENSKEEQLQQSDVDNGNRAPSEIDDRIMQQYWITKFMYGTAVDKNNQYTQFPTTFSNYFKNDMRAKIDWSIGGNKLSGNKGSKIQGTFMVPRQFIYTATADKWPITDTIYAGAVWGGVPDKNEYQFRIGAFEKNSGDFRVTISEQVPYKMQPPVEFTSGKYEGNLADFQMFSITIERIRDATHTEDVNNGFWIDLDWIFNPRFFYGAWYIDMWYREFKQTMNQAIRVDFQDLKMNEKLTAESVPQQLSLGEDFKDISVYDLVTNVKLGNQVLTKDDYTVSVQNTVSTDTVEDKIAKVLVTYKKDTNKNLSLDVPVKVLWGNSIVYGGYDYLGNGRTTAAFTLNKGDNPFITAAQGGTRDDNSAIHSYFPDEQYYTFNWFDLSSTQSFLMNEEDKGTRFIQAKGNDLKKDKLNEWGVNQKQAVNYGDVVRAWQLETSKNWIYEKEQRNSYNEGKQSVYYEITQTGYKHLTFNQATINKRTISIDESDKEIDNKIEESIELPTGVTAKFIEYPSREKEGDAQGLIRVSQKLDTGKTIEYDYVALFEVVNDRLTVETKEADIFLGTIIDLISPNTFIKSVRLGEKELSPDDYIVELTNKPYTGKIGKYDWKIKVSLKDNPEKEVESDAKANIVWGSSIISKANSTGKIDSSVSLLDNNGVPYLKATEGDGFSSYGGLLSRPRFDVYRKTQDNKIFNVSYQTVKNSPQKLMNIWNEYFSNAEFKYGDVMRYENYSYGAAASNQKGKNTWVSRNNSLTRETQGYPAAFYEFTKNGLHLMQINQLNITNGNRVPLNTTKEEMNQNIDKYITIPTHIKNPEDYRMEFESIDTKTSGNKTSEINVYQKLQSGGEFKMSYSVNYTVNPTIEETSYDTKGNAISDVKKTTFDFGKEYRPNPEKYMNKDNELYVYQGWMEYPMTPGKDTPNQGLPGATKVERKFYYIYEKADKYINVTIPTEIVFGTFDNTEVVKSNKYEIKNNSKELTTNVSLESFQKGSGSVKLLGENEAPDETKDSARLNLLINDESKIKGLNEAKFNISLADLEPENTATIGINGEYYARTSQINIVEYNTKLKFKAVSGK